MGNVKMPNLVDLAEKQKNKKTEMPNLVGYAAKKTTTQTRAALPLPSVGVSEKEPTQMRKTGANDTLGLSLMPKVTPQEQTVAKASFAGNRQTTKQEPFSAGKLLSGVVEKGLNEFSQGIGATGAVLEKVLYSPLDLVTGEKFGTAAQEHGIFTKARENDAQTGERLQQKYAANVKAGGKAAELVDKYGTMTVATIPDALFAIATGGGSAAPEIGKTVQSAAYKIATSYGKNPQFWTSLARVLGTSYEQAKADGASEADAYAYAIGNGMLNAAIEVGGGIQTLPGELQNESVWRAIGKTMVEEAGEEVTQGIVERGAQNLVYGKSNPLFSLTNENAVLNPNTAKEEAIGGAVVGGLLGGGQAGMVKAANALANRANAQNEFERIRLKTAEEEAAMQKTASEGETVQYKLSDDPAEQGSYIAEAYDKIIEGGKGVTIPQNVLEKYRAIQNNPAKKLMQVIKDYYDEVLKGTKVDVNMNGNVVEVVFENDGKKKSVGWRMKPEKAATFEYMHEMFDNAEYAYSQQNRNENERTSIPYFHYFITNANIDGQDVPVKLQVRDVVTDKNNRETRYYTHNFQKNKSNDSPVAGAESTSIDSNAYVAPDTESTSDGRASLSGTVDTVALPVSENSMPENGGNVKSYNAVMPRGDEKINTEANRRSEQSEFERIRLKNAEEEAAEREANKPVEMTNTDYEQQRRDLDEYWEMVGKQATMTREAPEKVDTKDLVTAEATKEKKNFKESVKDLGATLRRKWIDSADAVSEIGKATGDKALYPYFNMARASSNAALNMITTAQTNVKGETVGKSLNDIFGPIRAKGNDYYNLFQTYLFHRHNVDRMSRYSQENVNKAAAALQTFKTDNPELLMYEQYQLEQMAQDEWSDYNVEAKEYLRLLRELRKAENTKNKPVFGFGWGAEESGAEADKLLREHPEFAKLAEDVYAYTRNLMQYRADSGLITEEQKAYIESIYPHYVPTFRVTEKTPLQMDEKAVQIGSTIKQAKGGDQKLIPLHKALADQTMSVVREGSKNRFGQRLLSAERSKAAKEHLRHVEETENGFSADAFDDTKDDFDKITNTFTVRSNGKRYDITVSPDLYEGIKALTPEQLSDNRFLKGARRANDLFKKLCTSMSPTFMIRNPIKDLQDAGLYSKNAGAFAVQFPQAVKEISANGEYWQRYKALGGTYTSFFDYETGDMEKRSKLAEKTVGRIETLNNAIEQAPRLAEFMATVKKAGGLENASMDTLMQAMHNAADVTVNFGRSGTIARTVNRYVPFFNAGMQGLSKNVRLFTETKGAKDWTKLVTKCIILGVAPRLINEMAFGDRDDWDDIKDEAKDQNYLFPIGENKWLKIPKGRALSTFGLLGNAAATAMSGEEIDARYILDTAADNLAPANPLKNNIFAAAMDSDLFDPSSPGTTWYGGGIESQRLQNYAPAERYDAKTDELSKWLGKTLGLSPKKINYILDQYTGFAGDVILPMLTTAAETSPFVNAFVVDSTTNNKLSGDFYDKLDELTFAKNGKGATGADAVAYRWFNKQSSAVSEINAAIREIEADATLSGEEKKDLLEAQYKIRNAAEKSALDMLERYADAAKFYYDAAAGDEDDRVDDAYLRANREVFGAAYALQTYNKQVYEKATEANAEGVDFDDYFDFYFATREIEADKDASGKSISGSKKEKVLAAIDAMDITDEQKDALYLLQGYSEKTINEAPWNGGKAPELPKLPELPELPKLELPKLELPALELPR